MCGWGRWGLTDLDHEQRGLPAAAETGRHALKFLIADDHPIMLIGLRQLILDAWPQAEVESAETVEDACARVARTAFDAVVLDLVMPDAQGTEGVARMLHAAAATPVLVISFHEDSAQAARLLQMGVAGFLPKAMAATELVVALQRLLQGKRYVTEAMAGHLVDGLGPRSRHRPPHEGLSTQEYRVMLLIAEGMPPAQIGELMQLSARTVGTYRARIFEKTGWKSNVELSKYCLLHGLTRSD